MEKITKILILILFTFSVCTSIFSQDGDKGGKVKVIIHHPPPGRLNQADLWNVTLINSGKSVSAYLSGSMMNNENGELIATGKTVAFDVKPGTTNFKVSDLPSVPDINYLSKDPKYKQSFMNTGGAPPGDYKFCVELRYTDNTVASDDCLEQKVIGGDAPQLISPRDEEELLIDNPVFTWMHMNAPGSNQKYTLRIVELKGDESPENAMLKNKAFFEKEGITQQMLQYPSSAPKFEEGKKYVWMVSVFQNGVSFLKSNIYYFTNKVTSDKKITPTLTTTTNGCDFFDDYSPNADWKEVKKGSTIGTGPYGISGCVPRSSTPSLTNGVSVNGGQCVFNNVTEEGSDYRVYRTFSDPFKTNFETSMCWEAKFEFSFTTLGADNRVGHPIFALTADSPEPGGPWNPINYSNADNSVPQSAFCNFSNQDAIMVWLWLPTTAYYNAHPEITTVPPVGTRKAAFFPWCKLGTQLDIYIPSTTPIYVDPGTYFIKLERIDATKGKISVYSDNTYSNTSLISMQCFDIPAGMGKLNTLQHSNAPDGVGRELTGTLDNTCIKILNPGSISCGTTTPPSNCNSDCKLITANVSTIVNSNITLKTYVGEFTSRLNPLFSNTQSNLYNWGNQSVSPPITVLLGSKYLVKATGGMPDQWGRVYDAAYQLSGTFDLSNPPVCQGFSQFMLVNPNIFNINTRPTFPQNNYNWRYHEYLYEFQVPTYGPANVTYTNINNVAGGSGHVQAFFDFYKICMDNQFIYQWDLVGGNISNTYLSNANISSPVFRASSDGEYIYEVKIYCNNQLVDRDTTKIYVNKSIDLQNQKYFYPTPTTVGGCGFWSDIAISVSGMTGPFVSSRHGDVINVNSSVTSIYFKTSYSFAPAPTSLTNTLFCWVYKKNNIGDPNWLLANPPVNLNGITTSQGNINNSPTSINSLDLTGTSPGNYFWVRINPNIGNPLYPCTERNFYIKIN
ncbi:MAG: hypothetical protein K1X86_14390 [Ignavibacteria bacterium]|nr:hypothetical protein [Ignavibacteria bacterium]